MSNNEQQQAKQYGRTNTVNMLTLWEASMGNRESGNREVTEQQHANRATNNDGTGKGVSGMTLGC